MPGGFSTTLQREQDQSNFRKGFIEYRSKIGQNKVLRAPSEQRMIQRDFRHKADEEYLFNLQSKKLELLDFDKSLQVLNPLMYQQNQQLQNTIFKLKNDLGQSSEKDIIKHQQYVQKREDQKIQQIASKFEEGSTLATLDQTSQFYSGKTFVEESKNYIKFATSYPSGLQKGILSTSFLIPSNDDTLPKPPKKVQFNEEAVQVTYEREDYFQYDQSIFRDQAEMLDCFQVAKTRDSYKKKELQIFETDELERKKNLEAKMNEQVTQWGGNSISFTPHLNFSKKDDQPVKPENKKIEKQNEDTNYIYSYYKKDYKYYLTGNPEENAFNSVNYLLNYRGGQLGGMGEQIQGKNDERELKQDAEDIKQEQKRIQQRHIQGLGNDISQQQGEDTQSQHSRADIQSRVGSEASRTTKSELVINNYKDDIIDSLKHLQRSKDGSSNLLKVKEDLFQLALKSLDFDEDEEAAHQTDTINAINQKTQIQSDFDYSLEQSKDLLRRIFNSSRFDQSTQHQLLEMFKQDTVKAIKSDEWDKIKKGLDSTQQAYTDAYDGRRKKPKQYNDQEKMLFQEFQTNLQKPLDRIHEAFNMKQKMLVDQKSSLVKQKQQYLDSLPLPNPLFQVNQESLIPQIDSLRQKGDLKNLFRQIERNGMGNQHMSVNNKLEQFDMTEIVRSKMNVLDARQLFKYDLTRAEKQPLDHITSSVFSKLSFQCENGLKKLNLMDDMSKLKMQGTIKQAAQNVLNL